MTRVLIVDDEQSICWGLSKVCQQLEAECDTASSSEQAFELVASNEYDVVISDVRLPGVDGLAAISRYHELLGEVPVIIITAFGDLQTAVSAIKHGAFEYVVKPFDLEKVKSVLRQAITASQMLRSAEGPVATNQRPQEAGMKLIGSSSVMQSVFRQIALTTATDASVLLTGESGTGKELAARMIHHHSSRADGPFVAVNIASLSPNLAESELFGHVKGAFTGADKSKSGYIEQAHGGTLFLDEVADIPLEIQVKLLRVLDQMEVFPVGSNQALKTDFRLITATHQNLLGCVNAGAFRHDLFYRLRAFEIQLPPLRERPEDIVELVHHFVARESKSPMRISDDFMVVLQNRYWPGNVRQLEHVVMRAIAVARKGVLLPEYLEEKAPSSDNTNSDDVDAALQAALTAWLKQNWNENRIGLYDRLISNAVDPAVLPLAFELSGNQYAAAARQLGIHRTTLKRKLDSLNPPEQ